jgi:hypothetical protein
VAISACDTPASAEPHDLEVLELGCGYRATQLIALERKLKKGIGVDFQIAPELQALEKFTFH